MKAFLVLIAIVGAAVLGVKWFSEKDARMREKEAKMAEASAANATPAAAPTGTPAYRSPLEAAPKRTANSITRQAPPPKQNAESGLNRGAAAQDGGSPLNRPAYR
jgi:hypothetical protein